MKRFSSFLIAGAAITTGVAGPQAANAALVTFSDLSGAPGVGTAAVVYTPSEITADATLSGVTTQFTYANAYNWTGSDWCVFTNGGPNQNVGGLSVTFSSQVQIPTIDVTTYEGDLRHVTITGYAHAADTTAAVTIADVTINTVPRGAGNYAGSWVTVTGLAGISVEKLVFTSDGGNANIDNMGVVAVPEPVSLSLLSLGGLSLLRRRR